MTSIRQMRPAVIVATLGAAVAVICLAAARTSPGDPMLGLEAFSLGVLTIWSAVGLRAVLQGRRLARALNARSAPDVPEGVACRIVQGGGRRAFVLGVIRPQIYLGDELMQRLDAHELRAVLLHEEHHRRTLAPLRAVALEAWLTLLGRVGPARRGLLDRLTDLEEEADAAALRRGADPSALASALVKTDSSFALGTSFGTVSARRLRTLVALADGTELKDDPRLPYEWLPVAAVAIVALACHVSGLSPFA
jgi:Zn-dependent protease with chaperone function